MKHAITSFIVLLVLASAQLASAATITVAIEGIPGDNPRVGQEGSIAAIAASIDFQNSGNQATGGGGGAGKAVAGPLTIIKNLDVASPQLFLALATGRHFPNVVLRFYKDGETLLNIYTMTLSDVTIGALATANNAAQAGVVETVRFNYRTIRMRDELNKIETGFDFGTNAPL